MFGTKPIYQAKFKTYGGEWRNGRFPEENLKTKAGMWVSENNTDPRGVVVTFEKIVTITSFTGMIFALYFHLILLFYLF